MKVIQPPMRSATIWALYHTFQGGCSEPNDLVADTPAIAGPNFGCPSPGHNTCGLPGDDDYTNFMDYVDDPCMDHFTAGQFTRMRDIITAFRAGPGQPRPAIYLSPPHPYALAASTTKKGFPKRNPSQHSNFQTVHCAQNTLSPSVRDVQDMLDF